MKVVEKVWGKEEIIVSNKLYCLKYLHLKKGYRCSIHKHLCKNETFILSYGDVYIEYGKKKHNMEINKPIQIFPNTYHRFTGLTDSIIIEVSTKDMESDSYRKTKSGKVEDV